MPFITETQMMALARRDQGQIDKANREKLITKENAKKTVGVFAAAAGGAAIGYAHGRFQDTSGNWNIPKVNVPVGLTVGLAMTAATFVPAVRKSLGNEGAHVVQELGKGVLSGAAALFFAKHGAAAKAAGKLWAGVDLAGLPIAGLPIAGEATDSALATALRQGF